MSVLPCQRIRALLPLFAGADLDEVEADAVRAHLIGCMACRGEASGFQRATAGLRQVVDRPVAGVDEAMFTSLHDAVLARVEAAQAEPASSSLATFEGSRRLVLAAAALALVGVGFWWGLAQTPDSVWNRPPMATPAGLETPKAVPYAGPRAPALQLLGNEAPPDEGTEAGAGMQARSVRSLVEELVLPPRSKRPPR